MYNWVKKNGGEEDNGYLFVNNSFVIGCTKSTAGIKTFMKNDSYISIDFTKTGKYVEVFYNPGGDDYDILLTAKMPKKKFDSMTTPDWKLDEYSVVAGYKKSDVKKFSDDANDAITQAYSEWNDSLKKMGVSMKKLGFKN